MTPITRHLESKFALFEQPASALPTRFSNGLDKLTSSSIGEQLLCIVGTRESYTLAMDDVKVEPVGLFAHLGRSRDHPLTRERGSAVCERRSAL